MNHMKAIAVILVLAASAFAAQETPVSSEYLPLPANSFFRSAAGDFIAPPVVMPVPPDIPICCSALPEDTKSGAGSGVEQSAGNRESETINNSADGETKTHQTASSHYWCNKVLCYKV